MYGSDEPSEPCEPVFAPWIDDDDVDYYGYDQRPDSPGPYPDADDASAPLVPLPPVTDWSGSWGGVSEYYPTW